ncbi:MAG: GMC family oxidoreductase N-terminal domain-containing protein, partial [Planctomycetota bacterium]
MSEAYDVCVIGSGAGGGPVALTLAEAGYSVLVLEKGPWFQRQDFKKDEIGQARRTMFVPSRQHDPHVWEKADDDGTPRAWLTNKGWNGNLVGGATNLMSGFFYRLRPEDFRLKSTYGAVPGATVEDWPISYEDLAPYYDKVERVVGISGKFRDHPWAERRTQAYPQPPTKEHPFAELIDETCSEMGLHPYPLPRAVLSEPMGGRSNCSYTRFCGSYGCSTGAKGSSLHALVPAAVQTGRCVVKPLCAAHRIVSDGTGRAVAVEYTNELGNSLRAEARIFVVACQAIESARLLLLSPGPRHPRGLANENDLVGRNLLFSTFGASWGDFPYAKFEARWPWLRSAEPFVNRTLQDWYSIDDPKLGKRKGGTINFLLMHGNPIAAGETESFMAEQPVWGWALKKKLLRYFVETQHLRFEVFGDYTPLHEGRIILDPAEKDFRGLPVARAQIHRHPRDKESAEFLNARGIEILEKMGAENIRTPVHIGAESSNLLAG